MEWISVNDRLPKIDETIILLDHYNQVFPGCLSQWGNNKNLRDWYDMEAGEYLDPDLETPKTIITHWMPLPNPPKD